MWRYWHILAHLKSRQEPWAAQSIYKAAPLCLSAARTLKECNKLISGASILTIETIPALHPMYHIRLHLVNALCAALHSNPTMSDTVFAQSARLHPLGCNLIWDCSMKIQIELELDTVKPDALDEEIEEHLYPYLKELMFNNQLGWRAISNATR